MNLAIDAHTICNVILSIQDKWTKYNAWIKFKPEKHIHSKTKSECSEIPTYQCIVSKVLSKNFGDWDESKKCIPTGLMKMLHNIKAQQCETTNEEFDAFLNIYNGYVYKYKCPKPCSILEYSGKLDYWEPKYYSSKSSNNTMIIYLRFQSPEVITIYEEYLIYDFNGMLGSIGGTLGLFVGFSFSSAIELFISLLKRCKLENYNLRWNS